MMFKIKKKIDLFDFFDFIVALNKIINDVQN